jgi:type II secretion system protein G
MQMNKEKYYAHRLAIRIKGFTLIELLIVVAIIAILAAIAIPNYQAAQTRSKVTKAQAELKTLATGLESYYVDNNDYPPDTYLGFDAWQTIYPWISITTPVAYLTNIPRDEFYSYPTFPREIYGFYTYVHPPKGRLAPPEENNIYFQWYAYSFGPSRNNLGNKADWYPATAIYDPTNGVISYGQIGRYGP